MTVVTTVIFDAETEKEKKEIPAVEACTFSLVNHLLTFPPSLHDRVALSFLLSWIGNQKDPAFAWESFKSAIDAGMPQVIAATMAVRANPPETQH
jgi:hypothetical protein